GSGAAVRLAESPSIQQVPVPSSGGKTMVFARLVAVSGRFQSDLFQVADGESPVAILATAADERSPAVVAGWELAGVRVRRVGTRPAARNLWQQP
ncbi:MAG: hypothetical protein ACRD2N_23330, partial [Vicinamibacterales bacterium]